jgi:hypothetical protein
LKIRETAVSAGNANDQQSTNLFHQFLSCRNSPESLQR